MDSKLRWSRKLEYSFQSGYAEYLPHSRNDIFDIFWHPEKLNQRTSLSCRGSIQLQMRCTPGVGQSYLSFPTNDYVYNPKMRALVGIKRVIDYSSQKVLHQLERSKWRTMQLTLLIQECTLIPSVKSQCKRQPTSKQKKPSKKSSLSALDLKGNLLVT